MNEGSELERRLDELGARLASRASIVGPVMRGIERTAPPRPGILRLRGPRLAVAAAAAASVVLGAVGWFARQPGAGPDVTFGEVMQRVRQMDAVRYRQTVVPVRGPRADGTITTEVVNVDAPGWQVVKPDGEILQAARAVASAPAVRAQSCLAVVHAPPASQPMLTETWNVFDELLAPEPGSVVAAGDRRTIDNQPAVSFCIDRGARKTQVWVDPQTRLPVRLEGTCEDEAGKVTANHLQWVPRDTGKGTVLNLARPSGDSSGGKILVVPSGGNIDNMPMMAIPPGCKILIAGGPNQERRPPEVSEKCRTKIIPFQDYLEMSPGSNGQQGGTIQHLLRHGDGKGKAGSATQPSTR